VRHWGTYSERRARGGDAGTFTGTVDSLQEVYFVFCWEADAHGEVGCRNDDVEKLHCGVQVVEAALEDDVV